LKVDFCATIEITPHPRLFVYLLLREHMFYSINNQDKISAATLVNVKKK
jgi:hypothetical protein